MRVGIDCRLPAYQMGGISRYVLNLLPALAAQDTMNDYFVFHSRKDAETHVPHGARRFQRRILWTPPHHRFERMALSAELLRHRLDLLHSPDFIPPRHGAARHVITVHDLNFLHYPEFLTAASRRYYNDQISWAVGHADHILADSEATRLDLVSRLDVPAAKVTTVWLAVDPAYDCRPSEAFIERVLAEHGLSAGFLLFVGTLEPRKNLPFLLRAYERLQVEHGIDAPLVLIGASGWLNHEVFESIEALGLTDTVRHLPGTDNPTLAALYAAASALVLPSFYEGFGLPALEAMSLGCPVVASDRASLPEIIGDAGILLSPQDLDAWVDAILRVLTDGELRATLASRGHDRARKFSWDRTARETLAIYRQVVGA